MTFERKSRPAACLYSKAPLGTRVRRMGHRLANGIARRIEATNEITPSLVVQTWPPVKPGRGS